jgi:hypothetical protein
MSGMEIDEISLVAAQEDGTDTVVSSEEHLNIPSQRRQDLLAQLSDALGKKEVRSYFWACVQVCDLDQLQALVKKAEAKPDDVSTIADSCQRLISQWMQRRGPSTKGSEVSSPPQSTTSGKVRQSRGRGPTNSPLGQSRASSNSRDPGITKLAKERDGSRCVFTGVGEPEAAHIYHNCLMDSRAFQTDSAGSGPGFWALLQHFWTPKQIQEWQQEIFSNPENPSTAHDGCFNRICMRRDIHGFWTSGFFALRPVNDNDDGSELKVEWYWQPRQSHGKGEYVELTKIPPSSRDLDGSGDVYVAFKPSPGSSLEQIPSGQIFTLKTSDRQRLRLPSKKLLELQWHLNRIVSMSAAGGEDEEDDYDDNYDDDGAGSFALSGDQRAEDIEHWISQSATPLAIPSTPPLTPPESGPRHDERNTVHHQSSFTHDDYAFADQNSESVTSLRV